MDLDLLAFGRGTSVAFLRNFLVHNIFIIIILNSEFLSLKS